MSIESKNKEGEFTFQSRVELLSNSSFRDSNKISSAVKTQDNLRKKIGKWSGSNEIKKWRKSRILS